MKKIGGLEYEDLNSDGYIYRMVTINKTFVRRFGTNVHNTIGLNAKFLNESRRDRVHKIAVRIVSKDGLENIVYLNVPTIEELFQKMKDHEYEDKPSKFVGGSPMRIYGFAI